MGEHRIYSRTTNDRWPVSSLAPDGTLRVENVGHGRVNLVIDLALWYSGLERVVCRIGRVS